MSSLMLSVRVVRRKARFRSDLCLGLCSAPGISASPSEENLRYFNVMILGPTQSPYEGMQLYDRRTLTPSHL